MIFSENRYPLFGIMLVPSEVCQSAAGIVAVQQKCAKRPFCSPDATGTAALYRQRIG